MWQLKRDRFIYNGTILHILYYAFKYYNQSLGLKKELVDRVDDGEGK